MLHAVIVAGGSGTRFWPRSRRDHPKQFLKLGSERTLLQQSYDRLRRFVEPERIYVVTSARLAAGVGEQLPELKADNVVVEPVGKGTAVAMGLGAGLVARHDPEAVLVVTPADHVIEPPEAFQQVVEEAAEIARERRCIVTLGIPPRSPHTGYGYIQRGDPIAHPGQLGARRVQAFCEKPQRELAEEYLAGGAHYWNSGIFVWRADTILSGLAEHLPPTRAAIARIAAAWDGEERAAVLAEEYARVENISVDYAVMEKARDVAVVETSFSWSDVGSWAAIPGLYGADDEGNTIRDATFVGIDAERCLVQGDGRLIAVVGLDDVVVVQTSDATLVCPRGRAEEVKQVVARLEARGLERYT